MIVDSPWSDQSLFVEKKAAPPRLDVMAPGHLWKHFCMASVVASGEVISWLWDGYGMDGSCHGEHFDGSVSSQGPMALWTGPSMLPVLRAAFLGINFGYFGPMAALLLRWTHRLLSGRFYPWDGTLIQQKWRPPSKFHPVFIDGRSNLWSRGCFKASQGKFTANQSSYSQTNINQNKSISKVPPPHTHTRICMPCI